jgi:hypothetical protein
MEAIGRFPDDFNVNLLREEHDQSLSEEGVIVSNKDRDLAHDVLMATCGGWWRSVKLVTSFSERPNRSRPGGGRSRLKLRG